MTPSYRLSLDKARCFDKVKSWTFSGKRLFIEQNAYKCRFIEKNTYKHPFIKKNIYCLIQKIQSDTAFWTVDFC